MFSVLLGDSARLHLVFTFYLKMTEQESFEGHRDSHDTTEKLSSLLSNGKFH